MYKSLPKNIQLKSLSDEVELVFYGDEHWSAKACNRERFHELLSSDHPKRYYIGMGDHLNLIPHTDKRFKTTEIDEKFIAGNLFDNEVEDYISVWRKYKIPPERHLGMLEGNHTTAITSFGMNPIAYLCGQLKVPHLAEYSAIIPIRFLYANHSFILTVKIHHGWGGTNAYYDGSQINKFINHALRFDNWNISVYGHVHGFWAIPVVVLDCESKPRYVEEKTCIVACSGTFLKTMDKETEKRKGATYAERKGYPPRVLSWQSIRVKLAKTPREGSIGDGRTHYFKYPNIIP